MIRYSAESLLIEGVQKDLCSVLKDTLPKTGNMGKALQE